jgi:hypothetical protein
VGFRELEANTSLRGGRVTPTSERSNKVGAELATSYYGGVVVVTISIVKSVSCRSLLLIAL